ncbi:MAG: ATP-binding cassette domain-containing protein [Betaproteobacteria bacterium]|nr:ATP-binding cassette domain-containing protein [Betaproteobacteria bacterium]NDA05234.1 ATP-binding cassette domain-containing protein [Betaproteobacteria bacterium]
MNPPLVDLKGLKFAWTEHDPLIDLASWQVQAGEQLLISGPSGCGKSTLLALIAGLMTAPEGDVSLLGHRLGRMPAAARDRLRADHMGVIFQQFNLIPYLSALDNMVLACRLSSRRSAKFSSLAAMRQAAMTMSNKLDLEPSAMRRSVTRLSIGQQQRVAAVRALLGGPELVLADEPSSALDAKRELQLIELLTRQCRQQGTALILVSHHQALEGHFDRHWRMGG